MTRRLSAALVAAILLVLFPAPGIALEGPEESSARAARCLLHDGRFDEADETIDRLLARDSGDPGAAFLHAFVTYWRLLYDDENPALLRSFEQRLLRAAEVGEAAARNGSSADANVWAGSSRILLTQLRATQKRTLAAAREARQARRLLDQAVATAPASAEPLFGLGTYNYYADRVPTIVKGFRFLLRLPEGDRDRGLEQLEVAAKRSANFALESRLVLLSIYSSRYERLFVPAMLEAERALELEPDAVVALDAVARLELGLGRAESAARRLDRALERVSAAPRTDRSVVASLRYQRARAEFALFRPDRALDVLRPVVESPEPSPARLRRDALQLASTAARLTGANPPGASPGPSSRPGSERTVAPETWRKILHALRSERSDGIGTSAAELLRLSKSMPEEPSVWLLAGRALLLSSRGAEALPWLERADSSRRLPDPWSGPCRLMAGQAADQSGQRRRALEFYRKALKAPPFIESNAAYLYQQTPYPLEP